MICIGSFYTKYIVVIYMTHYTLSIGISYKIPYKDCQYGGNPGVDHYHEAEWVRARGFRNGPLSTPTTSSAQCFPESLHFAFVTLAHRSSIAFTMDSEHIRLFYLTAGGNLSDVKIAWIHPQKYIQVLAAQITSNIPIEQRQLWKVKTSIPATKNITLPDLDDDHAVEMMMNCLKVSEYFDKSPADNILHVIIALAGESSNGDRGIPALQSSSGDRGMPALHLTLQSS
jgi:hypothetical protein